MDSQLSHTSSEEESRELGNLEVVQRLPGRMVRVEPDGSLWMGRGYDLLVSRDRGATWQLATSLPCNWPRRAAQRSRLASRLLRQEVRALAPLPDGSLVAANRRGVFFGSAGDSVLRPSFVEAGEIPLRPPMRLTVGPEGVLVWGEYGSSRQGLPMRLFASRDGGRNHHAVHEFPAGEIGHVHNVVWDPALEHYWVFVGDHGAHPGIGRLSKDLSRFDWFLRGEQRYRVVEVFDFGDRLIYATDSEVETNGLIVLDKATGHTERLRDFEGSCIYACRFGDVLALTNSVEPSPVNQSRHVSLWLSRDGEHWSRAFQDEKDGWNANYFQFGSLVLPSGRSPDETILFSGQAVRDLDGQTVVARLAG